MRACVCVCVCVCVCACYDTKKMCAHVELHPDVGVAVRAKIHTDEPSTDL